MVRDSFPFMFAVALGAGLGCSHNQEAPKHVATPTRPPPIAAAAPARIAPQPPPAPRETPEVKDDDAIFFDFDSSLVRDDARPILQKVADRLHARPASLRIEGNCDEVGTVEYNIALGEHRAKAAKEYLVHLGVAPAKISTISYGSQRPKDTGHDDSAHARNRRDDLVIP
jgi:peptidoglycan-associated lipoprotein